MPVSSRLSGGTVLGLSLVLALVACKSKSPPAGATTRGAASAASAAAPLGGSAVPRCREVGKGPSLSIGERGPPSPAPVASAEGDAESDEDDDATTLPFAARVGSALALPGWFAAAGLTTRGGATEASVALVPTDGGAGRIVSLERVHGDVNPPLLAGRGAELLAAVPDHDAGGGMLRLSRLSVSGEKPVGDLQITGVEHDVGAAFAAGEKASLLVFGARHPRGVALRTVAIDPVALKPVGAPHELEGSLNGEAPALVARPGGYWLVWVAQRTTGDAGAPVDAGGDDLRLVDIGPRILTAVVLDVSGKPSGAPRVVSGERSHVVGFDAVLLGDGALALAWREDDAGPGVEGGALELGRVGLDGATARGKLDDEDLSPGLPALFVDPAPGGRAWVAVRSASDAARIGWVAPSGVSLESLTGDKLLRAAEVLAANEGRLLVSHSRGRALELTVLECKP